MLFTVSGPFNSNYCDSNKEWEGYESVKKWTKNFDIFTKQYIVVPINEQCVQPLLSFDE